MMIGLRAGLSIWIATQPVDFRRGMDSLAMLVSGKRSFFPTLLQAGFPSICVSS
jgi:hypothetical protein